MAFDSDVDIYSRNSADATNYGVSEDLTLATVQDRIICRRSAATEGFIVHVNEQIGKIIASGELKKIISEH